MTSGRGRRAGAAVRLVSAVLCFGSLGLIWVLVRRPGAGGRRRTWSRIVAGTFVVLQVVGAAITVSTAVRPPVLCHTRVFPDGRVQPEPQLQDVSPPRIWGVARDVVNAPATGLGLLASRAAGMSQCAGPPLTVTFWEPTRPSGGGSTIGSAFVAWMPAGYDSSSVLPGASGHAHATDRRQLDAPYIRYGPNISGTRSGESELARHESRHSDQWAVGTLIGGPLTFPLAYYADSAFFPGSRNHFERAAGLADGNYSEPPDNRPTPIPGAVPVTAVVVALVLRRQLRSLRRTHTESTSHLERQLDRRAPHRRGQTVAQAGGGWTAAW
ncbi:hypothetical protein [Kribbella shirazensis]|uniref:Uncharacterized protein n=1 Tax=Kribbella shirazensis TaxID=1105143 RepID=A0A7X5VJH1_9ACTN|nr:hypothetical protein [Kribbella shirazensis]NIK61522.1 hypothetical protein [Kribbella shirazensis]